MSPEEERQARNAAFEYVKSNVNPDTGVITRDQLEAFRYEGQTIRLIHRGQGIFKPKDFTYPVSILTTPPKTGRDAPYPDELDSTSGNLLYRLRAGDPNHWNNRALRQAAADQIPMLYLHGVEPGRYFPSVAQPISEVPQQQAVALLLGDLVPESWTHGLVALPEAERTYRTREVSVRMHQAGFRSRVLTAYESACALCRLKQPRLLEAAHIIPHADGGEPVVPNGLAMCNLHHKAFDSHIIGLAPQTRKRPTVELRQDVLAQADGPMLKHGLQELHGQEIWTPTGKYVKPDKVALEQRYEDFKAAP